MIFIFGGAYQGKLDYAKAALGVAEDQVYTCAAAQIDFSKPCIYHLERFTLACVQDGIDPAAYFRSRRDRWRDSILICDDISCGVVPFSEEARAWREATGRLCQYLAAEAAQVSRIFCGLERRLK